LPTGSAVNSFMSMVSNQSHSMWALVSGKGEIKVLCFRPHPHLRSWPKECDCKCKHLKWDFR